MRRARKYLALRPSDQWLLASACLTVLAVRLRLAWLPFRRELGACCTEIGRGKQRCSPDRIAWAVDLVSGRLGNATCLARALAAQRMLARRGFPSRLHIGVAPGQTHGKRIDLVAHAWLEFGGRILLGGPDVGRYTPLYTWCK